MVKKSEKQLKRMNVVVTASQYDWLRKQAFVLRKPMSSIFRDLVEIAMHPQAKGELDAEKSNVIAES